jgi:hypothetical protein
MNEDDVDDCASRNIMRPDEEFAARSLVKYLGGPSAVSIEPGENPPDFYLRLGSDRVGVEVTRLSQFACDPNGTRHDRNTQDAFGLRLLNELDTNLGRLVPSNVSLFVAVRLPVGNGARFRRSLTNWLCEIISAPQFGAHERYIEGSKITVSVTARREIAKPISGLVTPNNLFSRDIVLNARLILEDRITAKNARCSGLPKPVWLALLNDYWLADADSYQKASQHIKLSHCFARLLIVSERGVDSELVVGT